MQANYGARELLRVDGVPVGREIGPDSRAVASRRCRREAGSIIVVLATDAPLLPLQCQRLARRATTGLAWVGGIGDNGSGDIFLAFATGNHMPPRASAIADVRMLAPDAMTPLFQAAAEATEEAILNALRGRDDDGRSPATVHALPLDRLAEVMRRYGRAAG